MRKKIISIVLTVTMLFSFICLPTVLEAAEQSFELGRYIAFYSNFENQMYSAIEDGYRNELSTSEQRERIENVLSASKELLVVYGNLTEEDKGYADFARPVNSVVLNRIIEKIEIWLLNPDEIVIEELSQLFSEYAEGLSNENMIFIESFNSLVSLYLYAPEYIDYDLTFTYYLVDYLYNNLDAPKKEYMQAFIDDSLNGVNPAGESYDKIMSNIKKALVENGGADWTGTSSELQSYFDNYRDLLSGVYPIYLITNYAEYSDISYEKVVPYLNTIKSSISTLIDKYDGLPDNEKSYISAQDLNDYNNLLDLIEKFEKYPDEFDIWTIAYALSGIIIPFYNMQAEYILDELVNTYLYGELYPESYIIDYYTLISLYNNMTVLGKEDFDAMIAEDAWGMYTQINCKNFQDVKDLLLSEFRHQGYNGSADPSANLEKYLILAVEVSDVMDTFISMYYFGYDLGTKERKPYIQTLYDNLGTAIQTYGNLTANEKNMLSYSTIGDIDILRELKTTVDGWMSDNNKFSLKKAIAVYYGVYYVLDDSFVDRLFYLLDAEYDTFTLDDMFIYYGLLDEYAYYTDEDKSFLDQFIVENMGEKSFATICSRIETKLRTDIGNNWKDIAEKLYYLYQCYYNLDNIMHTLRWNYLDSLFEGYEFEMEEDFLSDIKIYLELYIYANSQVKENAGYDSISKYAANYEIQSAGKMLELIENALSQPDTLDTYAILALYFGENFELTEIMVNNIDSIIELLEMYLPFDYIKAGFAEYFNKLAETYPLLSGKNISDINKEISYYDYYYIALGYDLDTIMQSLADISNNGYEHSIIEILDYIIYQLELFNDPDISDYYTPEEIEAMKNENIIRFKYLIDLYLAADEGTLDEVNAEIVGYIEFYETYGSDINEIMQSLSKTFEIEIPSFSDPEPDPEPKPDPDPEPIPDDDQNNANNTDKNKPTIPATGDAYPYSTMAVIIITSSTAAFILKRKNTAKA